jgi:hypothetical protein
MPIWDLTKEAKFVRLNNAVATGTTTVTTNVFSVVGLASAGSTVLPGQTSPSASTVPAGFDGITVIVALNAVTSGAVITVNLQDNNVNSSSGMANVNASFANGILGQGSITAAQSGSTAGLVVTDSGGAAANGLILLDVVLPQLQFFQVTVARGSAVTLDGIFAILYRSKERPVIHDVSVVGQGYFVASS